MLTTLTNTGQQTDINARAVEQASKEALKDMSATYSTKDTGTANDVTEITAKATGTQTDNTTLTNTGQQTDINGSSVESSIQKNRHLKDQIQVAQFFVSTIEGDNAATQFYTGLPSLCFCCHLPHPILMAVPGVH